MLGNTLGTWGTCWEPIGNFMGTIKIQNPNAPSKEKKDLGPMALHSMNGLSASKLKTLSVLHLLMPKDFKPNKSSPRFYLRFFTSIMGPCHRKL